MATNPGLTKNTGLYKEYAIELSNPVALVFKAAAGVKIQFFDALLDLTLLKKNQLAAFIDSTPKTIDNYRQKNGKFGRIESEQLLQILVLYDKGTEIFGTNASFNEWLDQPAFGLGGSKPFDLLYSQGGINLVLEELSRIEYGALA